MLSDRSAPRRPNEHAARWADFLERATHGIPRTDPHHRQRVATLAAHLTLTTYEPDGPLQVPTPLWCIPIDAHTRANPPPQLCVHPGL